MGVGEFVAELAAGAPMISGSWPAGAFTERNDVHFVYDGLVKPAAKSKDSEDPLEVLSKLLPHAYLVDNVDGDCVDVSDPEAVDIKAFEALLGPVMR